MGAVAAAAAVLAVVLVADNKTAVVAAAVTAAVAANIQDNSRSGPEDRSSACHIADTMHWD